MRLASRSIMLDVGGLRVVERALATLRRLGMTEREAILREVEDLPDALLRELAAFLRSLKANASGTAVNASETALLSESSLAKDWDRPEEDEAWKDL